MQMLFWSAGAMLPMKLRQMFARRAFIFAIFRLVAEAADWLFAVEGAESRGRVLHQTIVIKRHNGYACAATELSVAYVKVRTQWMSVVYQDVVCLHAAASGKQKGLDICIWLW